MDTIKSGSWSNRLSVKEFISSLRLVNYKDDIIILDSAQDNKEVYRGNLEDNQVDDKMSKAFISSTFSDIKSSAICLIIN